MRTRTKGFTLIELLVVIAIIAVLAAILFPVFAKARDKARASTCTSNQRQIAAALAIYVQDHSETFPDAGSVWSSIAVEPGVLKCPSRSAPNGYFFNGNLCGNSLGNFTDAAAEPVSFDGAFGSAGNDLSIDANTCDNIALSANDMDARHSEKVIASFADGHVSVNLDKSVLSATWTQTPKMKAFYPAVTKTVKKPGKLTADATGVAAWTDGSGAISTAKMSGDCSLVFKAPVATSTLAIGFKSKSAQPLPNATTNSMAADLDFNGIVWDGTTIKIYYVNSTGASATLDITSNVAAGEYLSIVRYGSIFNVYKGSSMIASAGAGLLTNVSIPANKALYAVVATKTASQEIDEISLCGFATQQ